MYHKSVNVSWPIYARVRRGRRESPALTRLGGFAPGAIRGGLPLRLEFSEGWITETRLPNHTVTPSHFQLRPWAAEG